MNTNLFSVSNEGLREALNRRFMRATIGALVFGFLCLAISFKAKANALVITNGSFNKTDRTVTFNLKWNNSWRVDGSGSPFNWDAAWVFVKMRQCGADPTTDWVHGVVDTASALNNWGGTLEPDVIGTRNFYRDRLGVMLRRSATGIYPDAAATTITMRIENMNVVAPTGTEAIDVKIFGIEMVFVPQGAWWAGGSDRHGFIANSGAWDGINITSEASRTVNQSNWVANTVFRTNTVPATFPKAFAPFYAMKYEITHGQYVGFLNTLVTSAHLNRWAPPTSTWHRWTMTNTGVAPNIYATARPDRALNYISWNDMMAYLDWAALRPLSEFEFEKMCRGTANIVWDEYPWGTNTIGPGSAQTLSTSPENGTETIFSPATANCNYNGQTFSGGDGGQGPSRVGIYARSTSTDRIGTGSGFYGHMDLAGNIREHCVQVWTNNLNFNGLIYGDGQITNTGAHNVANWNTLDRFIIRGGSWQDGPGAGSVLTVGNRQQYDNTNFNDRNWVGGGRGGRGWE